MSSPLLLSVLLITALPWASSAPPLPPPNGPEPILPIQPIPLRSTSSIPLPSDAMTFSLPIASKLSIPITTRTPPLTLSIRAASSPPSELSSPSPILNTALISPIPIPSAVTVATPVTAASPTATHKIIPDKAKSKSGNWVVPLIIAAIIFGVAAKCALIWFAYRLMRKALGKGRGEGVV